MNKSEQYIKASEDAKKEIAKMPRWMQRNMGIDAKHEPTDLAWAAGFFDGEGCVQINKKYTKYVTKKRGLVRRYTYSLSVSAGNMDLRPLRKLIDMFGGGIAEQRTKEGKFYYQWKTEAKKASSALTLMLPYMMVKKEISQMGVDFQNLKRARGNKLSEEELDVYDGYYQRMKEIHKNDYSDQPRWEGLRVFPGMEKQEILKMESLN